MNIKKQLQNFYGSIQSGYRMVSRIFFDFMGFWITRDVCWDCSLPFKFERKERNFPD